MKTLPSYYTDLGPFLSSYNISPERGFLGSNDPLIYVPSPFFERFEPWLTLGSELPRHLALGSYTNAVARLPTYTQTLAGVPEAVLWRVLVSVGFCVQAYIWQTTPPTNVIPAGLAVLFAKLCKKLNVGPAFNYSMYTLRNWKRIDPNGPISVDNLTMIQHFNSEEFPERYSAEDWFVAIHIDIEKRAGALINAVMRAEASRHSGNGEALASWLIHASIILLDMRDTINRMNERCLPATYFAHVRPYLSGFVRVPGGVVLQGVKALDEKPQYSLGQTGAQSSIAPMLDRFLGIDHQSLKLSGHLSDMLMKHTPPKHRAFVCLFDQPSRFKKAETQWENLSKDARVLSALITIRHAFAEFRKAHYVLAITHIARPAAKLGDHAPKGTGGTDLIPSLLLHLSDTLHPTERKEVTQRFKEYFRELLGKPE